MHRIPLLLALVVCVASPNVVSAELQVGAAVVDVTPIKFPAMVNGSLVIREVSTVKTPLNARAIVLDDGKERIAIVVVDSCMMPREFLDQVKDLVTTKTGLKKDRILISATHCHSAPSTMGKPGIEADADYIPFLRVKIAEAIVMAEKKLQPAQVGFAKIKAAKYTALRRWIRRPDRIDVDPFGNPTVRATMHAAGNWDNVIGQSGPEDPDLSLISFQTTKGEPLAVLANFSMHYFSGEKGISADYFGLFCEGLKKRLQAKSGDSPFVGLMSHGCSGDIWRRDYALPPAERPKWTIESYSKEMVDLAIDALQGVQYKRNVDLAMVEMRMQMQYRQPTKDRLEWAQRIKDSMGERLIAKDRNEFYALQQIFLHENKSAELVVQGLRIGDIGVATTPNETYALTGLKIKLQSPLEKTIVIELANGANGYIPPPEQHLLGGYNTWPMRGAGLEVSAEPKITEAALNVLEMVSGRSRRVFRQTRGPAAEAIAQTKPIAWWRLDDFAAPHALDSTGRKNHAVYEPGVVFFLDGPQNKLFCQNEPNRSAHFAGGRLRARLNKSLGDSYSISLWFWNGMPTNGRKVTGWMMSRGNDQGLGKGSDHLGLGGSGGHTGRMIYQHGGTSSNIRGGKTEVARWSWNHVVFVREKTHVRVYLNGRLEIDARLAESSALQTRDLFVGGRSDNDSNWEGRLDEVAVFNRILSAAEIRSLSSR